MQLNEALFQIKSCLFFFLNQPPPHSHPLLVCSIVGRKARALYACKAEHDSELSFIAGTIFENGESPAERKKGGMWVGVCRETND